MSNSRWSALVQSTLEEAGWYPGRDIGEKFSKWQRRLSSEGSFTCFPAAEDALREYGGLVVDQSGAGVECARDSFRFHPLLAVGEQDRFSEFEDEVGIGLYPLGDVGNGHAFLAIGTDGRVFWLMDDIHYLGPNIRGAIVALVEGRRSVE